MSVLALTTTFVPASSCLTDVYLYYTSLKSQTHPYYFYSLGPPDTSDCFPSGWEPVTTTYFSPGVCPHGYDVACSNYNFIGTLTETIATCCPKLDSKHSLWKLRGLKTNSGLHSGYTCYIGPGWYTGEACASEITSSRFITVTTTNPQGSGTTQTELLVGDGINAFGVIIQYQSSDFITGVSTTSQQTSLTSPGASASATAVASTSAAITSTSIPSSGLSTSARISMGAGIGGGLALLLVFGGVCFWLGTLRVRRRRSESHNVGGPQQAGYTWDRNGESIQQPVSAHEMQASKLYPAHEMEEPFNISELEGSRRLPRKTGIG